MKEYSTKELDGPGTKKGQKNPRARTLKCSPFYRTEDSIVRNVLAKRGQSM